MTDDRWIIIPKWDEFQHRDAGRGQRTVWLRDYARQLDQDEYRDLTFHQRGLLRDLRHSYATTHGQLRDNTLTLTRRLGQRVLRRDLEALNRAGYIAFSASKPPALGQQTASLEVEVEVEVEKNGYGVRTAETWQTISDLIPAHLRPNTETDSQSQDEEIPR